MHPQLILYAPTAVVNSRRELSFWCLCRLSFRLLSLVFVCFYCVLFVVLLPVCLVFVSSSSKERLPVCHFLENTYLPLCTHTYRPPITATIMSSHSVHDCTLTNRIKCQDQHFISTHLHFSFYLLRGFSVCSLLPPPSVTQKASRGLFPHTFCLTAYT
jgi:hypothetical protein